MQNILIGLVLGVMIGGPIAFFAVEEAEPLIGSLLVIAAGVAVFVGIVLLAIAALAEPILRLVFGRTASSLNGIALNLREAAEANQAGNTPAAVTHLANGVYEAVSWYSRVALRRWILTTAATAALIFGGTVGAILIYRQNMLLQQQNNKIDQQISLLKTQNSKMDVQAYLADGQRRASLAFELSNIFESIDSDRRNWAGVRDKQIPRDLDNKLNSCGDKNNAHAERYILSDFTMMRIASLSKNLSAYFPLKQKAQPSDAELSNQPVSPERSQLLRVVLASKADTGRLFRMSDFSYADMSDSDIEDIDICGLEGDRIIFSDSKFRNVRIFDSYFSAPRSFISYSALDDDFLLYNAGSEIRLGGTRICLGGLSRTPTPQMPPDIVKGAYKGAFDKMSFRGIYACNNQDINILAKFINGHITDSSRHVSVIGSADRCLGNDCGPHLVQIPQSTEPTPPAIGNPPKLR